MQNIPSNKPTQGQKNLANKDEEEKKSTGNSNNPILKQHDKQVIPVTTKKPVLVLAPSKKQREIEKNQQKAGTIGKNKNNKNDRNHRRYMELYRNAIKRMNSKHRIITEDKEMMQILITDKMEKALEYFMFPMKVTNLDDTKIAIVKTEEFLEIHNNIVMTSAKNQKKTEKNENKFHTITDNDVFFSSSVDQEETLTVESFIEGSPEP